MNPTRPHPLLAAADVSFSYEKVGPQILTDLSVAAPPGKITALIGANGSGTSYATSAHSQLQWHTFAGRHKGGVGNIVWADGHASSMQPWINLSDSTAFPAGYIQANLGDIDEDKDGTTDELYSLTD